MIYVIYGPGGSGKSRLQIQIIADKLRQSRQNVSTNLALDLPRLSEYLEEKYPTENLNVLNRVRVLTEEETKYFWRFRGPRRWTGNEYDYEEDKGVYGTCFIIDEAGAAGFSAKAWAALGDARTPRGIECAAYLDQQRKYSDDVYFSTNGRNPNRICKDVRDVAHYFIKLRNEYLAQFGIFRGRGRFVAKIFDHEPGPSSEPVKEETFQIDSKGLASCYRTESGVGISGTTNADRGARAKGISIWWALPAAFALAASVFMIPQWLGSMAGRYVQNVRVPKVAGAHAEQEPKERPDPQGPGRARPAVSAGTGLAGGLPSAAEGRGGGKGSELQPPSPELFITGIARRQNRFNVILSDGRTLTEGDGVLDYLKRTGRVYVAVLKDGTQVRQKQRSTIVESPSPLGLVAPGSR